MIFIIMYVWSGFDSRSIGWQCYSGGGGASEAVESGELW